MLSEEQIRQWIEDHEICVVETWDRRVNQIMSDIFVKLVARDGESIKFLLTPSIQQRVQIDLTGRSILSWK